MIMMHQLLVISFFVISFNVGTAMMTGAYSTMKDINSPKLQEYAKFATEKVSMSSNSLHHMKLVNISKVETQVVAGINYKMELMMGQTECRKNVNTTNVNVDECKLLECKPPLICDVVVWVKAWLDSVKLTHSECKQGKNPCSK